MSNLLRLLVYILLSVPFVSGCAVKPNPISDEEHWLRAAEDKAALYQDQLPLTGPLTLPEAIARALTYNYDHRLAMMEGAFQRRELTVANLGMLPKLTASAGYTMRSNESASRSISYFTRSQTLEPSISQERQRKIADLSFNWSALDFGLSYFQAKQYADRYLIMEERRRRVTNNIVKDVVAAYWRLAMAEMLRPQVNAALGETHKALASYRQARESGLEALITSLDEEKRLLQIASGLKSVSSDLAQARTQLAALINVPLNEPFTIVPPDQALAYNPPKLPDNIEELEDLGLYLRPDLRETSYQERIDKNEVKKEIVRLVPGLNVVAGTNYDSNIYSYHKNWSEASFRVSSNLLGLIGNYYQYQAAKTQVDVSRTKRLATMVAAMVQIRLAYHQYLMSLEDYGDSRAMSELDNQIYEIINSGAGDGSVSELERVNRHTDMIASRLQEFHSLASVYEAWGNLYFALGGDLAGQVPLEASLEIKTALIEDGLNRWWSGRLPQPPKNATWEEIWAKSAVIPMKISPGGK